MWHGCGQHRWLGREQYREGAGFNCNQSPRRASVMEILVMAHVLDKKSPAHHVPDVASARRVATRHWRGTPNPPSRMGFQRNRAMAVCGQATAQCVARFSGHVCYAEMFIIRLEGYLCALVVQSGR